LSKPRRAWSRNGDPTHTHELVKEAGIAVQTFYKYFGKQGLLLLAVIEDMIAQACAALERAWAVPLRDPVARLASLCDWDLARGDDGMATPGARFVTTEHWRLYSSTPMRFCATTLHCAARGFIAGSCRRRAAQPSSVEHDAWLATQLVMAVFHHNARYIGGPVEEIAEGSGCFCYARVGRAGRRRRPRSAAS